MKDHFNQEEPYGIEENHFIRHLPEADITGSQQDAEEYAPECNQIFETFHDYEKFLETSDALGSDINTDNFWEGYNEN